MSAEIATLEKVQAAVAQLHRSGQKATADAVIGMIGGGSKPTVLRHLKALREKPQAEEAPLPPSLVDLIKPAVAQIYAEGARAEGSKYREQTERLHRLLGDLEAQVEELATANNAQEGRIAQLLAGETKAVAALAEADTVMTRQREEILVLQEELAGRNAATTEQLAKLMGEFELKLKGGGTKPVARKRARQVTRKPSGGQRQGT